MFDKRILFVVGTRPELIKVAPVVLYFREAGFTNLKVVNTGQHKELMEKYWSVFGLVADYNLDVIKTGQDLSSLTERSIHQINNLVCDLSNSWIKPDLILAQGDTTTVMATSLVSFYNKIKFIHLEAGLRSNDLNNPYPEELNRRIASIVAYHHLAPTDLAKENLVNENVDTLKISVVGNTVVDALNIIRNSTEFNSVNFNDNRIEKVINDHHKIVLITCHRRENHNSNLVNLIETIDDLSFENPDTIFIWPVHPNPNVRAPVYQSILAKKNNVILCEPLEYIELLKVIEKAKLILTDSGGIQEEAPSFNVPVLILRDSTERPEAIKMGYSKLVGCNKKGIIESFYNFKPSFSKTHINPYGDGKSSGRIYDVLKRISLDDV